MKHRHCGLRQVATTKDPRYVAHAVSVAAVAYDVAIISNSVFGDVMVPGFCSVMFAVVTVSNALAKSIIGPDISVIVNHQVINRTYKTVGLTGLIMSD